MIRLPPTAITLGPVDLLDFEIRQLQNRINYKSTRSVPAAEISPEDFRHELLCEDPNAERLFVLSDQKVVEESSASGSKYDASSNAHRTAANTEPEEAVSGDGASPYANDHSAERAENGIIEVPALTPSKDDFHYGGFIESPATRISGHDSPRSSPFGTHTPEMVDLILMIYSPRRFLYSTTISITSCIRSSWKNSTTFTVVLFT